MERWDRNSITSGLALIAALLLVLGFRHSTSKRMVDERQVQDSVAELVARIQFAEVNQQLLEALRFERARALELLAWQLDADETQLQKVARDAWESMPADLKERLPAARQPVELRRAAAWGMLWILDETNASPAEIERLWPALEGGLRDGDWLVRAQVAALPEHFDPASPRGLELGKLALKDGAWQVRETAARSMGRYAKTDAEARRLLEQLANDVHTAVREAADTELRLLRGFERAEARRRQSDFE